MEKVIVKNKYKCVILATVIGLMFSCLGLFVMFSFFNYTAKATGETTAMIVVDAGATTDITGGMVGTMENGNSIYVADTGILNMTGGTVEGNIYNAGTFNYTAGSIASVTLASGKYITFKGAPTTAISITLDNPVVGANVGYLSGISTLDLTLLSVTNLPANTELKIVDSYIEIVSNVCTITIAVSPSSYGSVSQTSVTVPSGATIKVGSSSNILNVNGTNVTATASSSYSFSSWRQDTSSGTTITTTGFTVTGDKTIYAVFVSSTTSTYSVYVYARYSTSSSGTNSTATAGITGGTAGIATTSSGTPTTTTGSGSVSKSITSNGKAYLTATPASGYVFVGWYKSTSTTTSVSTNASYSPTITGSVSYYAFFRKSATTAGTGTIALQAQYGRVSGGMVSYYTGNTGGYFEMIIFDSSNTQTQYVNTYTQNPVNVNVSTETYPITIYLEAIPASGYSVVWQSNVSDINGSTEKTIAYQAGYIRNVPTQIIARFLPDTSLTQSLYSGIKIVNLDVLNEKTNIVNAIFDWDRRYIFDIK